MVIFHRVIVGIDHMPFIFTVGLRIELANLDYTSLYPPPCTAGQLLLDHITLRT